MIKNVQRMQKLVKEQRKHKRAHNNDLSDHWVPGKYLKNGLKHPKQMISMELEDAF